MRTVKAEYINASLYEFADHTTVSRSRPDRADYFRSSHIYTFYTLLIRSLTAHLATRLYIHELMLARYIFNIGYILLDQLHCINNL